MSPLAGFALGHGRSPCDGSVGKRRLLAGVWEKRNPAPRHRFFRIAPLHSVGEAVVCLAVEFSASLALMDAAPLLEEERDLASLALIPKRQHPFLLHRPGAGPALTADDHPVDSFQVDLAEVFQQTLD